MDLKIYVGKQQVKEIWNDVKNVIELSLPYSHEQNLIVEDVYNMLVNSNNALWVFTIDGDVVGYIVSEMFNDSEGLPTAHVILTGAKEIGFLDEIFGLAKLNLVQCGIKKIQFSSARRGMDKLTKQFGMTEKYVVFEGKIEDGKH